jgi:hypothetical protein
MGIEDRASCIVGAYPSSLKRFCVCELNLVVTSSFLHLSGKEIDICILKDTLRNSRTQCFVEAERHCVFVFASLKSTAKGAITAAVTSESHSLA